MKPKRNKWILIQLCLIQTLVWITEGKRHRSVDRLWSRDGQVKQHQLTNSVDFIWSTQTVAEGDTAVLHCSFDAIFEQLRNGNIDWMREAVKRKKGVHSKEQPTLIATGKKVVIRDRRFRVYRPHHSALSVLIIRRAKKRDAGIFKCNLAGSSTRHKYLILNVTESKIEAKTSPSRLKARIGKDVTLWCNGTGYPRPVVYWTREDRHRKLPDGSYQFWGNGLHLDHASEKDTGIYACYLDNFVQPVVSYKFSLTVEDRPWQVDGFKMRFDSSQWYSHKSMKPLPVLNKSYLLMCETRGVPKPLPTIDWYKDGIKLKNSKNYYILEDRPDWRTTYTSSTLVIMRFTAKQQGNYTCMAHNVFRLKKTDFHMDGFQLSMTSSVPASQPPAALPSDVADKENSDEYINNKLSQILNEDDVSPNAKHGIPTVVDETTFKTEEKPITSPTDDEDLSGISGSGKEAAEEVDDSDEDVASGKNSKIE